MENEENTVSTEDKEFDKEGFASDLFDLLSDLIPDEEVSEDD